MKHINGWEHQYAQRFMWTNNEGLNISCKSETFNTNNSLMVYTSSVNRTNIEDRTMVTEKQVKKELEALETALRQEARQVQGAFLTAEIRTSGYKIDWSLEDAEFELQMQERSAQEKEFFKGSDTGVVVVTLEGDKYLQMDSTFTNALEEFKRHIHKNYAIPMKEARRKLYLIRKEKQAKQELAGDKKENSIGGLVAAMQGELFS